MARPRKPAPPQAAPKPPAPGARKGAGRPLGSANKKTREIADRAAKEGITPLEVMLSIMRTAFETDDRETAMDAAAKCAPYIHARLSSVDLKATVKKTTAELTRDELLAIAAHAFPGSNGSPEEGRRETEPNSVH
jgi:hypothetical protein